MTYRKSLAAVLFVALLGMVGCNPNPGGPSAPSEVPEGTTTVEPAAPQKTTKGRTLSGPSPSSLE